MKKLILFVLYISLVTAVILTSNGGANYELDKGTVMTFYTNETETNNANYFEYDFIEIREIMKNGTPCCDTSMTGCSYNVGCNHHAIFGFETFANWTQVLTNTSVTFSSNREAESFSSNCIPPGNSPLGLLCANISNKYEVLNEAKIISFGNYSFSLKQDAVEVTIGIYKWAMNTNTSAGMRIKIELNIPNDLATGYYKLPQNVLFGSEVETNTFTGIAWQNNHEDVAAIAFAPFAVLDNTTAVEVNISGLYNTSSNWNAHYVYIYVPQIFRNSLEYKMSFYLPSISAKNETIGTITTTKDKSFIETNKKYIIYAAIALGVLIILIIGIAVCVRKTC